MHVESLINLYLAFCNVNGNNSTKPEIENICHASSAAIDDFNLCQITTLIGGRY